jgi:hypothetical protein
MAIAGGGVLGDQGLCSMAAMIFKVPPRRGKETKMRQKMREMLTTVILGVPTLRPSILLLTLAMVVVFALVCPVRSVQALNECSTSTPGGYCGGDFICCEDPDGTFRGCCLLPGLCCTNSDGLMVSCCHSPALCDSATGYCVAQCLAGTTECRGRCVGPCEPPTVRESFSCACILPCQPGEAQCGSACCPAGKECAEPAAGLLTAHCCPKGKSCGSFCKSELKSQGLKCCKGGPLLSGGYSVKKGQICCAGSGCNKATQRCKKGKCVPKKK